MVFSDETVTAYVDGELDESARAAIDAAITTDLELARRVARHRALRERLQREFSPVLQENVPERLLAAARDSCATPRANNDIPLRYAPRARWSWPQWGAIAAALFVGILIAPLLWRQAPPAFDIRNGRILATGTLAQALSQQLASNQAANAPVHIGVSFVSRSGNYCRTFALRDQSGFTGLACHEQDRWLLTALANSPSSNTSGEYRPATSSLPPSIAQAVNDLIAGEPLDASAEASARANGWQR
jgi:hypothetical protein